MTLTTLILFTIAAVNFVLGAVVYLTNSSRRQNQFFLLFTTLISLWGILIMDLIGCRTPAGVERLLRITSYVAVFIPVFFHLLCLAIQYPDGHIRSYIQRVRVTLGFSQAAGLLCFSRFFLKGVDMPGLTVSSSGVPEAHYGPGFFLYAFFFLAFFIWLTVHFVREMRRATGLKRVEFQFIVIGIGLSLLLGSTTNLLIPLLTGMTQTQPFGPAGVLAMNLVIAYGIATRKIMDVGYLFRLVTAYALLFLYLAVIYIFTSWAVGALLRPVTPYAGTIAQALAALVVAFLMAPIHGRTQRFADRLFVTASSVDVGAILRRSTEILQSVGTFDDVLDPLVQVISKTVGTDYVAILLVTDGILRQVFPRGDASVTLELAMDDPLVDQVFTTKDPVILDAVGRRRPSPALMKVRERLRELHVAMAVGISAKGQRAGLLLLGPRLSGRVYGTVEQHALQAIVDQLAVALENARLYTELQDRKLYNDILVDSLVSGVIAVNRNRDITVFNREAQRITRLPPDAVLGRTADRLPASLANPLLQALQSGRGVRHQDATIRHGPGDATPLQLDSSVFYGYKGDILGALLVVSDVSVVKRLEAQVRRAAHLASLGTLSAGMAHEIKNPLVTLKTFSQLLPDRFEDPEFRASFSHLVGEEVERIDGIVNQLLQFGKPAKATMQPVSVHDLIERSLKFMGVQMERAGIEQRRTLRATADIIQGDPNLLEQALVNFFLNAIESMTAGGTLSVSTLVLRETTESRSWNNAGSRQQICVSIQDTGSGIRQEDLSRIFDPFFTTKGSGTGLGLSIAHGIIQDHGGMIEVESEPGHGTTFRLLLPLM